MTGGRSPREGGYNLTIGAIVLVVLSFLAFIAADFGVALLARILGW